MVKLKDNIPFEKLKDYGFVKGPIEWEYELLKGRNEFCSVGIDKETRKLSFFNDMCYEEEEIGLNVIFDLITDGLLEKVPHPYSAVIERTYKNYDTFISERKLKPFNLNDMVTRLENDEELRKRKKVSNIVEIRHNDFGDVEYCEIVFDNLDVKAYELEDNGNDTYR